MMPSHGRMRQADRVSRGVVIGSGVMGAGIAAHLANAGMQVKLLDIVPGSLTPEERSKGLSQEDAVVRNRLADEAVKRIQAAKPPVLYDPSWIGRIQSGNLSDHLSAVGEADWVIEAVVERLDIKRKVLESIDAARRPGSLVTTNTSGLSVGEMAEGRSDDFRRHFAATHFFNPPRYMKLVEIVPAAETSPETVALLTELCEERLGKGVVLARDTPNFIANRIGAYGMLVTLEEAVRYGLTVEETDALTGTAMGRPKTATFRMMDMVGLDTLLHVVDNVRERSADAEEKAIFARPELLVKLVESGRLGGKSGAGFYRKTSGGGGRSVIQSLQLATLDYGPKLRVSSPVLEAVKSAGGAAAKVRTLLSAAPKHAHARFAWACLKRTLLYAAGLNGIIADHLSDIDKAMRWGFNWDLGPFQLWDAIGLEQSVRRMEQEGDAVPAWVKEWIAGGRTSFYRSEGARRFYAHAGGEREESIERDCISLAALKEAGRTVLSTPGASLIDIGDDVVCLEFHSQNNAIGGDILSAITLSAEEVSRNWRGLVIANEGRNFCVGANLALLLMEAQSGEWDEVEDIIRYFQRSMGLLAALDRPVVAAPHRMTLGGGVEACLPADRIVYSPETYFGLVETGVGLIPAGGGCMAAAMLAADRAQAASGGRSEASAMLLQPQLNQLFETIAMAKHSSSGFGVRALGFHRPGDRVIMRQDARIGEAKRECLELDRQGYVPPPQRRSAVAGREGKAVLAMAIQSMKLSGYISPHDERIAGKLAHVLTGGHVASGTEVSGQYLLDLECEAFLSLCGEPKTQQRMSHMLETGKPLRN
ncbi:3-hydroxyacyl-CoA dehydrogenase/enoyl-CoA hydratase family protein [Paenibacillus sp. J5C_2022]|uniref:3-hydroxyacyl-CoA dehydrogenase/enoyl-CoA hydratase family protein n=1 Tax=Paenibacillus sp. J5C2022 TaxID=2977129 RepID=UPI0021D1ACE6|nr:3-hydroxyacyl-CoA dehydrogenase/enoyl-CoA hydratase family protein [Paenibacillus sp. J5C2022]MCU6710623.1 3-hydroxyacyl-CoA dehydrogenase/enoyl-CoA hydratase family protein [Paenibacillus sp. J5C2022]